MPKPLLKKERQPVKRDIDFTELKREDFAPVTPKRLGAGLAKLATAPKNAKRRDEKKSK